MKNPIEIYRNGKQLLKMIADEAKRTTGRSDKPYIRQVINDQADSIIRQFNYYRMKEQISERQYVQFSNWLQQYACKLHP